MSRAVIMALIFFTSPAVAQTTDTPPMEPSTNATKQFVKVKTAEIMTVEDKKKCPEVTSDDGIVVCAEVDNGEDQLIFEDQRIPDSSGAQKQADAASCIPGTGCRPSFSGGVTVGFGKRRPPAIPYEEFLKDLPEPDAVGEEPVEAEPSEPDTPPE
jgi:hypothetical protein